MHPVVKRISHVKCIHAFCFYRPCIKCIGVSHNPHALRVEVKLLKKLQKNRLLQRAGDAMATGEAIIRGELMATG